MGEETGVGEEDKTSILVTDKKQLNGGNVLTHSLRDSPPWRERYESRRATQL